MSMQRAVFSTLAANADITDKLATYKGVIPPAPAIFTVRAPEDMEGYPYIVFDIDEGAPGEDQHWTKRNIAVVFHIWNSVPGNSRTSSDAIARQINLMYEHQLIVDPDGAYEASRCWMDGQRSFTDPDEKDDIIHTVLGMTILAYRKFLITALAD